MSDVIGRWGTIVGVQDASEPRDLVGLFQFFRPDGVGVDAVFSGFPLGDEILARVRLCYAVTKNNIGGAYFVPKPDKPCSDEDARSLILQHLLKMKEIAVLLEQDELVESLSEVSLNLVASRDELFSIPVTDESPEGWLYDLVTDFTSWLPSVENPLLQLQDAMYSIANNIYVCEFLLWPLSRDSSPISEPFGPAFELWSKGVSYTFRSPGSVRYCC